ncbi:transposase [Pseudoalteromonas sp. GCY]|nr:transposase [Pseudoalteromonas sp. GCY]
MQISDGCLRFVSLCDLFRDLFRVRPKYSCRHCEKTHTQVEIKQAPVPPSPIPKGIATASLLSQIITSKYQYGLPLYRQENLFKQYGIALGRRTMADWVIRCASLFKPLYDRLHEVLLQQPVLHADETTVKVVKEDKQTSYMWLYCSGTDSAVAESKIPNIALFDYQNSRGVAVLWNFYKDMMATYK